jgi:hypothetical protein
VAVWTTPDRDGADIVPVDGRDEADAGDVFCAGVVGLLEGLAEIGGTLADGSGGNGIGRDAGGDAVGTWPDAEATRPRAVTKEDAPQP